MNPDSTSVIYFVSSRRSGTPIKIGRSTRGSLLRRFSQIQVSMAERVNALFVLEGSAEQEEALHDVYARYRLSGEWFERNPDLERLIADMAASDPWWRDDFGVGYRWSTPPIVTRKQMSKLAYHERPRFVRMVA